MKKLMVGILAGAALAVTGCRNVGYDNATGGGSNEGQGAPGYQQNDDSTQFGGESQPQPYQSDPQPSGQEPGTGGSGSEDGVNWGSQMNDEANDQQPAEQAPQQPQQAPQGFDPGE